MAQLETGTDDLAKDLDSVIGTDKNVKMLHDAVVGNLLWEVLKTSPTKGYPSVGVLVQVTNTDFSKAKGGVVYYDYTTLTGFVKQIQSGLPLKTVTLTLELVEVDGEWRLIDHLDAPGMLDSLVGTNGYEDLMWLIYDSFHGGSESRRTDTHGFPLDEAEWQCFQAALKFVQDHVVVTDGQTWPAQPDMVNSEAGLVNFTLDTPDDWVFFQVQLAADYMGLRGFTGRSVRTADVLYDLRKPWVNSDPTEPVPSSAHDIV